MNRIVSRPKANVSDLIIKSLRILSKIDTYLWESLTSERTVQGTLNISHGCMSAADITLFPAHGLYQYLHQVLWSVASRVFNLLATGYTRSHHIKLSPLGTYGREETSLSYG